MSDDLGGAVGGSSADTEAAAHTPRPWHTGGIFNPDSDRPTVNIWGPTKPGDQSGELIAREVRFHNAPLLEAAPDLFAHLRAAINHIALQNQMFDDLRSLGCTIGICGQEYDDAKARAALAKATFKS